MAALGPLPFREARFQEYVAKRRVVHFGMDRSGAADPEGSTIGPLPPFLVSLRQKVADRLAINSAAFVHVLVSEYRPGTPIGWHRDKRAYGIVVGLSLAGWGQMRFRPDGPRNITRPRCPPRTRTTLALCHARADTLGMAAQLVADTDAPLFHHVPNERRQRTFVPICDSLTPMTTDLTDLPATT